MNIIWISKIRRDLPHITSRLKMSETLIKRGHNVTLYTEKKIGEKIPQEDNIIFIPNIHLPILSGIFYGLIVFFYFPIHLSRKKIDIIIIDQSKIWLPFVIPLRILNIPIVLDIRTLPVDRDKSFFFKVSMYLSKYVVDGITTITPELSSILRNVYNLSNKKIGVWSSGVSIEDFSKFPYEKSIPIELKNHEFILLYHGDYSATRGIENLISAMNKLDSVIKRKIGLIIIGIPSDKINYLIEVSEKEGVIEKVDIFPRVDYNKIAQYLEISDVGVIPLPPENIWWQVSAPLKTLEYLAKGKPIIATNIPFHQLIFKKGNCGILLESANPEDIAKGISYLFNNQKKLKKIGLTGKRIVEKYYTWDCQANQFEKFLKAMLV